MSPAQAPPPGPGARPQESRLRSARFRKGREESWRRLDALVTKMETRGLDSLSAGEAMELPSLYQSELSSLAVARHLILDRNLLEYLENLSIRAYLAVYGPRATLWEMLGNFFRRGLPSSARSLKWHVLVSFLLTGLPALLGYAAVMSDNSVFGLLVPGDLAGDRNFQSSPEELRATLFDDWGGLKESLLHFANFLFRHNTVVALLCFSLGFAAGVPTVVLLVENGLTLGAMFALFQSRGLGVEFAGWLSIHGVTEIWAIVLAGAAGLGVAQAVVMPGPGARLENLASRGAGAARVMIGVVAMLLVASILEGLFRQLVAATLPRYLVACGTFLAWSAYFLSGRRGDGAPTGEDDVARR
ncbi:MAG: stage II sporulation protein M [Deltaproteobacteria bacterium]|nr:stage II sporulation protein M [Deltaproteobacteria bacterium]